NLPAFEGLLPGLVPMGAAGAGITEAQWQTLARGNRQDVDAVLRETRIRYVIRQTLQPSPRLTSFCRTGLPVVRSDVLGTGASQYVFELYRLDGCHEPPPPPQTAIEQSRTVRRVLNAAIVHDLTLSGKGLGAPLAAGNTREPEGYGF